VFAPKVICGLGDLPDTLQSRSVRLELKRRAPGEHISRFRRRDVEAEAEPLAISLTSLADYCLPALEDARPHLPDELGDRAQDVWEPLCAIGDLAGNGWSERARIAAIALSAQRPSDDDSLGVRLLGDIRRAFIEIEADRIATSELLDRLHADEEAPWGDLRGKPVTARSLARMLKPYGIRTNRTVRFDHGTTAKGFHVEQFNDAFIRYLASESVTSVTTAQPSQKPAISIGNNDQACDRSEEAANPHQQRDVTDVTDRSAGTGDERQNGTRPLVVVGEPMYPILLAEAANHGHVTEDEFSVRFELHRRIGEAMRT
jgi:hypothetical protein